MAMSSGQGGDHEDGEESRGIAADGPRREGDDDRQRRVDGADLIAETAQLRAPLFRVAHDLHDLGVARIGWRFSPRGSSRRRRR